MRPSKFSLALLFSILVLGWQSFAFAETAPDWALQDTNGKTVKFSDFKGKVVIVDFWATWCPPCRQEIPNFIAWQDKYGKQGLAIVGISLDEDGPKVVAAFAKQFKVNYPLVMADENVTDAYGAGEAIPTTILIDRNGKILNKYVGPIPDTFEAEIKSALAK